MSTGFFALQANQRGAWKNVLTFDPRREADVLEAAIALARASGVWLWRISMTAAAESGGGTHVRWSMTGAYQWQRDPFNRLGAE